MKDLGKQFQPGSSALFLLVTKLRPERVIPEVAKHGGFLLKTSLPREQEDALRDALRAGLAAGGHQDAPASAS
jgi:uncharacterized membrane protein